MEFVEKTFSSDLLHVHSNLFCALNEQVLPSLKFLLQNINCLQKNYCKQGLPDWDIKPLVGEGNI